MVATPNIGSVMTAAPLTIDISASVREAQKLLSKKSIRHLPIMDGDKVVSVLSDRDINLALVATQGMGYTDELSVEDVCTLHTYSVPSTTPLDEVVTNMAERHIGSVLVIDDGQLVGIFTATDACKYLAQCMRGEIK